MTCTDFLAKMTDYFDGGVEPALLQEIREHLHECDHCEILVDTTQKTIQFYKNHQLYELSSDVRERTIASILQRCGIKPGTPPAGARDSQTR